MSVTIGGKVRVCVEPGVSQADSVVVADVDEILVFPHVDTCVAVLLILTGGVLVGGHASRGDMGDAGGFPDARKNLLDVLVRMSGLAAGKVAGAIAFGQFDTVAKGNSCWDWTFQEMAVRDIADNESLPIHRIDTGNAVSGVDIFADPGTRVIEVQRCVKDPSRGFLDAPRRQKTPALTLAFDMLKSDALEALKGDA